MLSDPHWLIRHASLASTNSWALDHLDALDHGTVVYTPQQTAGRGQHGRIWHSPQGVVTCSFIIDVRQASAAQLSLVAGLAVADTINDRAKAAAIATRCQLKWPNDVMLGEAKVAGILCEGRSTRSPLLRVVVGLGCNLSPDIESLALGENAMPASSLHAHGIHAGDELGFIAAVRDLLLQGAALLNHGRWQALLERIRQHDYLFGSYIHIIDGQRHFQGYAAGIDDHGHLLLTQPDGGHLTVSGGRIQLPAIPQEG